MIDRDSPVPVYYQIQQHLQERITRKEWQANDQMPSETELTRYYGVSRVTLRQALAELEKDGYIKRYRGRGAFITDQVPKPLIHDLNYELVSGERVSREGYAISAQILSLDYVSPVFPDIVQKLQLPEENSKAIYIKRLFLLDGKPIAIGKSWLPAYMLPDFVEKGMVGASLSRTLKERYGIVPEKVDDYMEAIRATQSESTLLNCTLDVPLLLVQGLSLLKDGTPMEYSQTFWLGDGIRFHIQLHKTDKGFVMG